MTRRRWIADTWTDSTATLEHEQAEHLARVLRAQPGMEYDVIAGGFLWRARIESVAAHQVRFTLLEELHTTAALPLTLGLSIFKFDRMEWAVEKAVELGATRIVPLLAQRTEKHLAQAAAKRVERWRRIAREAAQQCRRSDLPEIADPIKLSPWLASRQPAEQATLRILLAETEEDQSLLHTLNQHSSEQHSGAQAAAELLLAIGPEGGWTPGELKQFADAGWQSASLGPRILRVETAAIAALAVAGAWQQQAS
jgi:16S rRNA (uracil1498-N3)-methyltransferase